MTAAELEELERKIGTLPAEYREFLLAYPESLRVPPVPEAAPMSARIPGDAAELARLNQEPWTSSWRKRGFVVIGTNGVGDPYLVARDGSPGTWIGNHEIAGAQTLRMEASLDKLVAALEAEDLDDWRERCIAEGRLDEAIRLADAAAEAWKRHGRSRRATAANRARTSLHKLTDRKKNQAELRKLLAEDPASAAAALNVARDIPARLVEEILDAEMFEGPRAQAFSALWHVLPSGELVSWATRRARERRTSPDELFWLDWNLQRAGASRAERDALYAWLPEPAPDLFQDIDSGGGKLSAWMDLPIAPGAKLFIGDDSILGNRQRGEVQFVSGLRMLRAQVTAEQFEPFRKSFARPRKPWREAGAREPAIAGFMEAIAFARWVEVKTGLPVRLPTGEEWEVACRAGSWWPAAAPPPDLEGIAWINVAWDARLEVAQKRPNPWGLFDLTGLGWEWILSPYSDAKRSSPKAMIFDPSAVVSVPKYIPKSQTVCGGKIDTTLPPPIRSPSARVIHDAFSSAGFRLVIAGR